MHWKDYNDYGPLILRVFLGLGFLAAGTEKLLGWGGMPNQFFSSLFGGAGDIMLALAIVMEVVGGIMLLIGWHTRYAALGLAGLMAVAFVLTFHVGETSAVSIVREVMVAVIPAYFAGLLALAFGGSGDKAVHPD